MTSPVSAEQVVDVDSFVVQVHADPTAELVTRICRDLDRHSAKRVMVAHLAPDNPEHQHALAALIVALRDTFTWTLTSIEAEALDGELYEASTMPDQCRFCESFSVTKIEGFGMCHIHAAAHDRSTESSAS